MEAQYTDKELSCVDCGANFTFSVGEQEHHARLGFTNDPKRCKPCRAEKKRQHSGGSQNFGEGKRELFDVICDECSAPAKVPFKPTGNKPVYCSVCFEKHRQ